MRLRFILAETGKGLARNKMIAVAVVIVTYVSLLFVGIAALAQLQVNQMRDEWYGRIEVSIYMCGTEDQSSNCNGQAATEEQIEAVRQRLNSDEIAQYIDTVYEETEEDAYKSFQEMYGDTPLAEWTTADMLGFSFRIHLVDPEQYTVIQEAFSTTEGVSEVQDQSELVQPLLEVIQNGQALSIGLAVVMTVAAILLITTTIQLSALAREKETQIMRLVGASNLFIQAPFMIEGAIAALIGAALAIVTLFAGVHFLIDEWLAQSFTWTNFVGMEDMFFVAPFLVVAALLLALIASGVSLARYTRV